MRFCVFLWFCLTAVPALAQDKPAAAEFFFETKIRPVLAAKCSKCHGGQRPKSGLRVDPRERWSKAGSTGLRSWPAIRTRAF